MEDKFTGGEKLATRAIHREFFTLLQIQFSDLNLFCRSPTALHMHRVNCTEATYEYQNCINSTRYLSNSRVHALHLKQKALMKELGKLNASSDTISTLE